MDVTQKIVSILEKAKQSIQENMEAKGINASGRTSESIIVEKYDGGVRLVSRGTNIAPFETTEIGRGAGKVPQGFASIIKQWILIKPLSVKQVPYVRKMSENWKPKYSVEERSLNMAAGAIAFSIKNTGTERHKQNRNDIYSDVVKETVPEIKKEISTVIKEQIKTR